MTNASIRSARRSNGLRPKMRPIRQQRGSNVKICITTPLNPNDSGAFGAKTIVDPGGCAI